MTADEHGEFKGLYGLRRNIEAGSKLTWPVEPYFVCLMCTSDSKLDHSAQVSCLPYLCEACTVQQ